jgi:hypothetical protein
MVRVEWVAKLVAAFDRELGAIGCGVELVPFGQGFRDMAPAVDALERLIEEGKLRHAGRPRSRHGGGEHQDRDGRGGKSQAVQAPLDRPHSSARRDGDGAQRRRSPGAGDRYRGLDRVMVNGKLALHDAAMAAL